MTASITVIGSCAIDRRADHPPTPGGCPSFVSAALAGTDVTAHIITRYAQKDRPLFAGLTADPALAWSVLPAPTTPAFSMHYAGDDRAMSITALAPPWTIAELATLDIATEWVHLAPLVAGEFSPSLLDWLYLQDHRLSLDGQGLVRVPSLGPITLADCWSPAPLDTITVLKLANEEASGLSHPPHALGPPEVLVTRGSAGATLYQDGVPSPVPPSPAIAVADSTGAGDTFMTAYVAARAQDHDPLAAADLASQRVSAVLAARHVAP